MAILTLANKKRPGELSEIHENNYSKIQGPQFMQFLQNFWKSCKNYHSNRINVFKLRDFGLGTTCGADSTLMQAVIRNALPITS